MLDLGSRRLLGYSMAAHMRTELVTDALEMAVAARRGNVDEITFHGDRGSQYLSETYRTRLAELGMRQSVGSTGVCWDNAAAESFFSTLEHEVLSRHRFATKTEAELTIKKWCHEFYNTRRRHSSAALLAPAEFEKITADHLAAA